ncbi:PROTEIN SPT2-like protein [Salix koriyanagi]|uniref:PROTEIN SPT2-like protein n=1 Tax=Salix koriyanagi TaxID=2511006 RepID=A0A9Q1ANN6_9ROSI|nr:PROTEIN SPT2-like protein [Salix koriyanagi]
MDNRTKVQRLRQTRDYSFLFSDDNNPTLPVSSATPAQPPLACNPWKPLTNKRVNGENPIAKKAYRQSSPFSKAARGFAGRDDGDRKMEASFGDIMKEEKRSERLGRKEDQEQLRLLEENAARRQRMRTSAKKHNQGTRFVIQSQFPSKVV